MSDEEHKAFHSQDGEGKVGPALESARRELGLSLADIEQATKIRKRYIQGLEQEDYSLLPDPIYVQGFLKTYANYLGLDGERLARELKNRRAPRSGKQINYAAPQNSGFDKPLISPGGLVGAERRRISGTTVLSLGLGVLALIIVIGALYFIGRSIQPIADSPGPDAVKGEEAANQEPGGGGREGASDGGEEVAEPGTGSGSGAEGDGAADGEENPKAGGGDAPLEVRLRVEGAPSWLSIQTDGALAYEQIAEPGFSQIFEAERVVNIATGNAGAVSVEVNGQDYGVMGEDGEVLTREFTVKTGS